MTQSICEGIMSEVQKHLSIGDE